MKKAKIYYARMDELWTKVQKLECLENLKTIDNVDWQEITPDKKNNWLTAGLEDDFEGFIPLGSKETKAVKGDVVNCIFKIFSNGVKTNRDSWVYNFTQKELVTNIQIMTNTYNEQLIKWQQKSDLSSSIDDFVSYDSTKISWSRDLKKYFQRNIILKSNPDCIRSTIYRPFTSSYLYFAKYFNDVPGTFPLIFPIAKTEEENQVIWLKVGSEVPMFSLVVNRIPDLLPQGGSQCFSFYIYDKDGTNQQENITDWALKEFRDHYQDATISKWDIFYYTYAVLHHPHYRNRYAANLKRELPRIPFAPEFQGFAIAGKRLAEIHINYEQQPEYCLKHIENKDLPIDWRVEKMRLSKDKTQIKYNDFLTLTGIPSEVLEYRLGNRSALDWIIDQYQVSTDKRSGITNDPNRLNDEEYIVRLIKQVITVSLETVKIIKSLPDLGLPNHTQII